MAYDAEKYTEKELGVIMKNDKSFVRVAKITDTENNEEYVDIRQGFLKDGVNTLTGKGVRIAAEHVGELVTALEEFVNS